MGTVDVLAPIVRGSLVGTTARSARTADAEFLAAMLLEAVNWDVTRPRLTRTELEQQPLLWRYVESWKRDTDVGVIAHAGETPVAAAWARYFSSDEPGFGFVRPGVPEVAMGVVAGRRGRGLGRALLDQLIAAARGADAEGLSLSVEHGNARARRLYETRGFVVVSRRGGSDTMLLNLRSP